MGVAATPQSANQTLEITAVLRDTLRLYRTLFKRAFATGFVVFGVLGLLELALPLADSEGAAAFIAVLATVFAFVGTTFVQGALVEAVDAEHHGKPQASIGDLYRSSWARLGSLVGVSLLTGIGVGLGVLCFIVPGIILAIRWALAAPIVMLEGLGPRAAMRRSRELVSGQKLNVFRVLINVWVRVGITWFLLNLLLGRLSAVTAHPGLSVWLGGALASAFVTPYAGHALSVMYYRLTDPYRPVLPEPEGQWESIWHEQERARD